MAISKKGARNKGKNFERTIAKSLSRTFGIPLGRVHDSGANDIKGDVRPLMDSWGVIPYFNWVIECKNQKSILIDMWFSQMKAEELANSKNGLLVFHQYNTKRNFVLLRTDIADEFLYPAIVSDNVEEWDAKKRKTDSYMDFVKIMSYAYQFCSKQIILKFPYFKVMPIETFNLLYRKKNDKE